MGEAAVDVTVATTTGVDNNAGRKHHERSKHEGPLEGSTCGLCDAMGPGLFRKRDVGYYDIAKGVVRMP